MMEPGYYLAFAIGGIFAVMGFILIGKAIQEYRRDKNRGDFLSKLSGSAGTLLIGFGVIAYLTHSWMNLVNNHPSLRMAVRRSTATTVVVEGKPPVTIEGKAEPSSRAKLLYRYSYKEATDNKGYFYVFTTEPDGKRRFWCAYDAPEDGAGKGYDFEASERTGLIGEAFKQLQETGTISWEAWRKTQPVTHFYDIPTAIFPNNPNPPLPEKP